MNVIPTSGHTIEIAPRYFTKNVTIILEEEGVDYKYTKNTTMVDAGNYKRIYIGGIAGEYYLRVEGDSGIVEAKECLEAELPTEDDLRLSEGTFYILEVYDTTNNKELFRGKVYCTDQSISTFTMNNKGTEPRYKYYNSNG